MEHVSWGSMDQGTKEDYEFLGPLFDEHVGGQLIESLVKLLKSMEGPKLGYQIDRYEHSLQSASRALRNDESIDLVVAALLHDVADSFAPANHSAVAAAMVAPYVDDETHWVIKHHGLFQGYYYFHHMGGNRDARDLFKDNPYYESCVHFCAEYDQNCFDPDYPNLPLNDFIPMMEEVFSRPSRVPGIAPLDMTTESPLP